MVESREGTIVIIRIFASKPIGGGRGSIPTYVERVFQGGRLLIKILQYLNIRS